ncbi:hypothetical protein CDA63_11305 [Hymenobacter amundsenii]|uniref:Uncharacterized protein n=1 Tax=Hymenobacter amundsenii TaxID=2006685 RepID=A0A246FK72_9BACT|nr:hypothetical protein [Hymenobacter amundsenii]OWP62965.1 hypothetical protein CDA63_11305 [Hymenobacter amundsenii]
MLTIALPRRHRRPLLLPPGLLALAWLLWLGCVAVPQVREGPPLKVFALFTPRPLELGWHTNLFPRQPQDRPNKLVISNTVHVMPSPNYWLTYFFAQQLCFTLPRNTSNSTWQGSIFRFDGHRSAGEAAALIGTLERQPDLLYWFANFPPASADYVFRLLPPGPVECLGMINPIATQPYPSQAPDARFKASVAKTAQLFLTPGWRNSLLLLLLIGGLSAVRVWSR